MCTFFSFGENENLIKFISLYLAMGMYRNQKKLEGMEKNQRIWKGIWKN